MTPVATPAELIERLDTGAAALAEAVSLAIRIEPQLLRKMRIELFPAADAGAEADLWFSPVVESRTPSGIVLQQDAAQQLRQRLREKPAMLEAAWRVTESSHRNISPAILAEEQLAYLALAGKYNEMRELLRSVVATLVSPRGRALASWAARAIGRLPDEARYSEEAQMLAFGASMRLGESSLAEGGAVLGRATEWGAWLGPDDLETVPFGVALLEDAVEFGPVGRPRSHRLELPKTMPVMVELGWHDGSRERTEWVPLHPQKLTIVEIGNGVTQVDLRTVLGDAYWLTVPESRKRESAQKRLDRVQPPRVHITYDVEKGDAIEMRELPFVVGVLADLRGTPEEPLPRLLERKFVQIDWDNFDRILEATNPRLSYQVDNRLVPDAGSLLVELRFRGMVDFEPAQVARQVAPLRELIATRSRISEIWSLLTANRKLQNVLEKTLISISRSQSAERPRAETYLAEMIRSVEETGGVRKERAEELVVAFAENVNFPSGSRDLSAATTARVSEIDALISEQLRDILHHPDFQALESAWRGLHYLVIQTETSEVLQIRVLNVDKNELAQDFASVPEFIQSTTFKKIYGEGYGVFGAAPFGLLVGAYEFGHSPEDVELLENISRIAAASQAPFLAAASADMLRLDNFASLGSVGDLGSIFDSTDFARWNRFRNSEDSRYVGLTIPRILLRLPYGKDTVPVEEFTFEENVDGSDRSGFLWGSSAFAMASCVTRSFARYGWCAAIRGVEGGGLVEGLPTYTFAADDGEVALKCPTEIGITDRREAELSKAGFIPLVHAKNTDYAAFFTVNTVSKPRPYESPEAAENARLSVQLPYIFAVSRFAHYISCIARDKIGSFMSRNDLERFMNRWIANYVRSDDNTVMEAKAKYPLREARIEIEELRGQPGLFRAIALLRPQFQLDEVTVSLRVVIDLPAPAK
ncbi:MAG TPA: type VI secretion system contractile sheath large subunit [Candidatus Sulfotelmatobacter sp.]